MSLLRNLSRLWFACIACLACIPAQALDPAQRFDDYVRDQWGLSEGLPQVSVLSIVQDADGFIWVGTQNGIARFDGVRFVAYDHSNNGGHATTMVRSSLLDRRGSLWFGTERGLLHRDRGEFSMVVTEPAPLAVQAVAELPDGRIIAGTPTGVVVADGPRLLPYALAGEDVGALLVAPDGELWAGAAGALIHFTAAGATRIALPGGSKSHVNGLAFVGTTLWIASSTGLYRLGPSDPAPVAEAGPLGQENTESLLVDRSANLWIGTPSALVMRTSAGVLSRHGADDFMRNPWVSALFEDRDGNLWVGSTSESLFRFWGGWASRLNQRDGLTEPVVWSLAHDPQGQLVIGTNSNVMRQGRNGMEMLVDGTRLPNPVAYELTYDRRGRLWIGTRAGLARLDAAGAELLHIDAIGSAQVNTVIEAEGDRIWIGTSDGVFRWIDERVERSGPPGPGPSSRIRAILPVGQDSALLGTESGLRRIDAGQVSTPAWAAPLDNAFVTSIERIETDLVVITTLDHGVGVLMGERLALIGAREGLPGNNLFSARAVAGLLYLSADDGVASLPLADLRAFWQDPATRLDWRVLASVAGSVRGSQRTRCCNGGARSRALVDGSRIWFPTLEGALALELDRLATGSETPRVHVDGAQHGGRQLALPATGDALVLGDSQRDLSIAFTALAYRDPAGLRFAYRLDGFDADWIDAGTRRTAYYTNLPPGDFTFRVRAESAARVASTQDAIVRISVVPRWHERTGSRVAFAALVALLLALVAAFAVQWRTRVYSERQEWLQGVIAQSTAELAHANEQLRTANRSLSLENQTDALTGLHNRRWMLNHLGDWLRDRAGDAASCTLFAMFDLDHFKRMNERYGHVGGDQLLRQFADLLQRLAGDGAEVVRWGGEEFLVLLPGVPREQARQRIDRLWRQALEHIHPAPDGQPMVLTSSVGYSLYPPLPAAPDAVPWTVVVEMADAAAFQVKNHARNAWAGLLATPLADPAVIAGGVVGRLRGLLDNGSLSWDNIKPRPGAMP
jgi:diguanylate cyclase (GGDEF)-like protein